MQEVQKNPAAANKHVNDPRMMQVRAQPPGWAASRRLRRAPQVLGVLLGVNISTAEPGQAQQQQQQQQRQRQPEPEPDVEMTGACSIGRD